MNNSNYLSVLVTTYRDVLTTKELRDDIMEKINEPGPGKWKFKVPSNDGYVICEYCKGWINITQHQTICEHCSAPIGH